MMAGENKRESRLNRRLALRMGAAVGAAGAAFAAGLGRSGPAPTRAQAQQSAWRAVHLEFDFVPVNAVAILKAGSGAPQRGDTAYVDAPIYATGDAGGTQIGTFECFGVWTHAASEAGALEQRLITQQYHLNGRGAIMGLRNEAGANPSALVGAVQGGTGEFAGALGTFHTASVSGPIPGVAHGVFDLALPNLPLDVLPPNQSPS